MSSEPVIQLCDVSKSYKIYTKPVDRLIEFLLPNRQKHTKCQVLSEINLSIEAGESVGIIGENGAGKSTLLHLLCNTKQQTSGEVEVKGRISALLELGAGMNPEFTGMENIFLYGAVLGMSRDEIEAKVSKILSFADIGDFINQPVRTYSSGMYVRLAFAISINVEPDILIVDEALAVGDVYFQQKCFSHIRNTLSGVTRVFVTHDMSSLSLLADRTIVLDKGRIAFDGDTKEAIRIYNRIVHQKVLDDGDMECTSPGVEDELPEMEQQVNFVAPPPECVSGACDIKINQISVLFNNSSISQVEYGDKVAIRMLVERAPGACGPLVFGFFLRDRYGQMIFGQNTLSLESIDSELPEGQSVVALDFTWPHVSRGSYTLTVGIGEIEVGADYNHKVQCWLNDFLEIMCKPTGHDHGKFSVELEHFSIEEM